MEHTKHIWRISLLLILMFIGLVVGRHFLIPDTFGQAGFYRYEALVELMGKEPRHGPQGSCGECHDEKTAEKAAGKHANVQCEACHNVLSSHVKDAEKYADMDIDRSYKLCANCHQKIVARPASMIQIDLAEHLELEPGQTIADDACLECHDSEGVHSP
jgi:hypothetical protein